MFAWRPALVAAREHFALLIAGTLVLYALGETMNALVLAGLVAALSFVAHEAIVGAENIARRLRERRPSDASSTTAVILDATLEVRTAALYGALIVAVAVILCSSSRAWPALFLLILIAFLAALGASMVVALTVTPALSLLLASKERAGEANRRSLPGCRTTTPARSVGSAAWRIVYLAAGAIVVAGVVAVPFLGYSLPPTFKERSPHPLAGRARHRFRR